MKVKNPTGRPVIVTVFGDARTDHRSITVEPHGTYETDDYVIGSTLIEYGCTADPVELQAARQAWADRNRGVNSRTASASASEGELIRRQARQSTVSVVDGTVDDLKGDALDDAVEAANAEGAGIAKSSKADDKRAALRDWQANRPADGDGGDFLVDPETGDVFLDDAGQPYPSGEYVLDDQGNPVKSGDGD